MRTRLGFTKPPLEGVFGQTRATSGHTRAGSTSSSVRRSAPGGAVPPPTFAPQHQLSAAVLSTAIWLGGQHQDSAQHGG